MILDTFDSGFEVAELFLPQERMNEITRRGGAQIHDPPASAPSSAHMAMHRWHSSRGILAPDVPQPTSPLAEAPPPAHLKTSKA